MSYFKNAKVGDKVYGLIFGKGKIVATYENSYYEIIVKFSNGDEVPYTAEGIPSWGNFSRQTCYYRKDVDLTKVDFSPTQKVLSNKKIIKLREKGNLEMRLPSGVWTNISNCPDSYVQDICQNEMYHFFRKKLKK